MTTGPAWDVSNKEKTWALFVPNAVRVIPYDPTELLASMGTAYGSHTVTAPEPLECTSPGTPNEEGVIPIRMAVKEGASFTQGKKYPFTIRIVGADGQQDERTLWLKLKDR